MATTLGPWKRSAVAAASMSNTSEGWESTVLMLSTMPEARSTIPAARHSGMPVMARCRVSSSVFMREFPFRGIVFVESTIAQGREGGMRWPTETVGEARQERRLRGGLDHCGVQAADAVDALQRGALAVALPQPVGGQQGARAAHAGPAVH